VAYSDTERFISDIVHAIPDLILLLARAGGLPSLEVAGKQLNKVMNQPLTRLAEKFLLERATHTEVIAGRASVSITADVPVRVETVIKDGSPDNEVGG